MAAPACHMPFHSQSSAPTLVTGSNGVLELARFFTDVEYLFEDCQINADADKKQHILCYLELQDSQLWESLPTFAAGTYAAWKNEVRALYPGTSEEPAAQEQLSVKDEAILALLSKFMDKFDAAPPCQKLQQPHAPRIGGKDCHFCGKPGHRIRDCQQVGQAVHDGKCQRNHEGRIILPSGAFVLSNTPGDNIKAKINEWHPHNPGQLAAGWMTANAGTMLYEVNQVLSYDTPPPPLPAVSAEEQIWLLQQEVLALCSG
ncbi:hypothetical protein H0H81_004996 [Sphagnurus paluster]|uniref:CCHC-type domain-containing protein n=1 Tax=Sphagnurus paluster TaxID=117069 RepID=A0A9P7GT32_9AGAR|nr:hypothetical protein H0H81_004996 [Sphagnurus paluster]